MIKNLDFKTIETFISNCPWAIVFARPLGSKLHRVFKIPDMPDEQKTEVVQTLNTLCFKKHKDVWYFILDSESEQITVDTFMEMDIIALSISPSPQILN